MNARRQASWIAVVFIALFFALLGLRGVSEGDVIDTDAARHAMNGVVIHDYLRDGRLANPLDFANDFYSHLPALSMPFHPPLFPAIEAVFYFLFGVNLFAARMAIAVSVFASALLLYRVLRIQFASSLVALLSVITFLSLAEPLRLASDVMLEFPAMVFVLGALTALTYFDISFSLSAGLAFAALAGAAVWTKQQTIFVVAVPFVSLLIARRWRRLLSRNLWLSSLLIALAVIALVAISLPYGHAGIDQAGAMSNENIFWRNLRLYKGYLPQELGNGGVALTVAAVAGLLFAPRRLWVNAAPPLMLAWAACACGLLLFIRPYSGRYLFFALPALLALGYAAVLRFSGMLLSQRWAWVPAVTIAAASCFVQIGAPPTYLRGPGEAARLVMASQPHRILYCGGTDGNFMFAVRSLESRNSTVVIAGDKLDPSTFTPARLDEFARFYGVEYVIFERARGLPVARPWNGLLSQGLPNMDLRRDLVMASSDHRWNGDIRVYQFNHPSPQPASTLKLRMNLAGSTMNAHF